MSRTWSVRLPGHHVHRIGERAPRARHAFDARLTAELAFRADLVGDARDFRREARELVDHRVERLFELEDLAPGLDGDLLVEVAVGHGGGHARDVADLVGQVRRHEVDVLGQPAPGAAHALDVRLAAQLAFRADFARDARHFGGEARELVDHRVDGVLELEDLALDVDGDLLVEIAVGDGGGHPRDVADLVGEVAGHHVHRIGQPAPGAAHALHVGLPAELALGAHLVGDAGHLARERRELAHHRVHGVLELEDLSARVDHDLLDRGRRWPPRSPRARRRAPGS
jgi:hypothetical protein